MQFATYKNPKRFDPKKYSELPDIRNYLQDGWVKYTTGNTTAYNEALTLMKQVQEKSKIKDAFVVAFKDEKRISIEEALKLVKNS